MTTTEPREDAVTDPNAVSITINGRVVAARKGEMIIAAADRTSDFIPRFCYHPRMSPVGMCRQCLVEIDTPRGPAMVVSCMTPVSEGQVVRTATDDVKKAQEGVLELLLANHPLDCPVCDKGGECPLQDQAFSHGPGESRYVEEKRHYEKPIPISDNVFLDRERCILCDRCTRFADEVAGDPLISFTSRGNNTQVMTFPDEPFSSYFSGNTVQICPVGALTAKPYRFKARPWDLEEVESTCTTCAVGCRTVVQSSRDELVRVQGVDVDPVNWGWLCDRGRFNFESVNSNDRLTHPLLRNASGDFGAVSWSQAMDEVSRAVRTALATSQEAVAIIGGARGTNEDAFAWASLADALGVDQRDAQLGDGLPPEVFALPQATIDDVASSTTTILLAPDLKEELPVLYLRLRHAAERRTTRIVELTSRESGLTRNAWRTLQIEPGMFASAIRSGVLDGEIAAQLSKGSVSIVVGRPNLAESSDSVMSALAEILHLVPHAKVLPVLRRGNVRGAVTAGLTPRHGAGDTSEILERAAAGKIDVLMLLGADPLSDFADADLARRAIASVKTVVAIDGFMSKSASAAHVVLPAAIQGEKVGTTTNIEGRVSTVAQKVTTAGTSRPDWMIALELAAACGKELGLKSFADVQRTMIERVAEFAPLIDMAKVATDGVLLARAHEVALARTEFEGTQRNSYQFRLVLHRTLYDQAVSTATSPSLRGLATGSTVVVHPLELPRIGGLVGDRVVLTSPHGSVVMPIAVDERVMRGTAWIAFNQLGADARELVDADADVVDVKIERVA